MKTDTNESTSSITGSITPLASPLTADITFIFSHRISKSRVTSAFSNLSKSVAGLKCYHIGEEFLSGMTVRRDSPIGKVYIDVDKMKLPKGTVVFVNDEEETVSMEIARLERIFARIYGYHVKPMFDMEMLLRCESIGGRFENFWNGFTSSLSHMLPELGYPYLNGFEFSSSIEGIIPLLLAMIINGLNGAFLRWGSPYDIVVGDFEETKFTVDRLTSVFTETPPSPKIALTGFTRDLIDTYATYNSSRMPSVRRDKCIPSLCRVNWQSTVIKYELPVYAASKFVNDALQLSGTFLHWSAGSAAHVPGLWMSNGRPFFHNPNFDNTDPVFRCFHENAALYAPIWVKKNRESFADAIKSSLDPDDNIKLFEMYLPDSVKLNDFLDPSNPTKGDYMYHAADSEFLEHELKIISARMPAVNAENLIHLTVRFVLIAQDMWKTPSKYKDYPDLDSKLLLICSLVLRECSADSRIVACRLCRQILIYITRYRREMNLGTRFGYYFDPTILICIYTNIHDNFCIWNLKSARIFSEFGLNSEKWTKEELAQIVADIEWYDSVSDNYPTHTGISKLFENIERNIVFYKILIRQVFAGQSYLKSTNPSLHEQSIDARFEYHERIGIQPGADGLTHRNSTQKIDQFNFNLWEFALHAINLCNLHEMAPDDRSIRDMMVVCRRVKDFNRCLTFISIQSLCFTELPTKESIVAEPISSENVPVSKKEAIELDSEIEEDSETEEDDDSKSKQSPLNVVNPVYPLKRPLENPSEDENDSKVIKIDE